MSKLEGFGGESNKTEVVEDIAGSYNKLLGDYYRVFQKIKATQRRYPIPGDPEVSAKIADLDKTRHETHLKLLELGKSLSKEKDDVLVDIIRQERTLEEYGLPEFSILKEKDVIATGDWHNAYEFNVDTEAALPNQESKDARVVLQIYGEDEQPISKEEFMLVFAIAAIRDQGDEELLSDDYYVREARAQKLAQEMNGKLFEERDSNYHEGRAKILGVIFPKKDLEKIAEVIRSNPEKFRLGKEFYSEEERVAVKKRESTRNY